MIPLRWHQSLTNVIVEAHLNMVMQTILISILLLSVAKKSSAVLDVVFAAGAVVVSLILLQTEKRNSDQMAELYVRLLLKR